ncbi:hypothetical protein ACLOJK_009637 [Asimina triloba]
MDCADFLQDGRAFGTTLELATCITRNSISSKPLDLPLNLISSDVGSERSTMQPPRSSTGDGFRISVSSTPSYSSHSSGPDDCESLGDVYVWGEVWGDGSSADGSGKSFTSKTDVLIPRPLESNVVLDVHQISCGIRHVALVTKQGEVFTWGEECGGQLGHGIDTDANRPQLVESLALINMDSVACGEYHTCAISMFGDLFSWGDGMYSAGLLGHGTDVCHSIPKRICGSLEGLQVLSIACGSWHSALTTTNGKLFTFGDGAFGVLGHGDRQSITYPKEVESLSGLRTVKVACGLWHTAAIVEVMGQQGGNMSSRKLFTWGDGDKNRLGHGNKETMLVPTCVSPLIDYNFHQLACGHSITVALSISGHVFTMGSTVYGQLGNPQSDGRIPCVVQDRLVGELVEEISCGAYHVAVLTSKNEVFTWGKGANGRLGHGDSEDRKTPTLIEALKDKHVKSISCGSNFTASICIHKWVSGPDQSVCSGCRQAFGFTRKRHNCYNCGLVHCHACSSKKVLKAALAPTPGKPHRVCDVCYAKLKASEANAASPMKRKNVAAPRPSVDARERLNRGETRSSSFLLSPSTEPIKFIEVKLGKLGMKPDAHALVRAAQVPSSSQLKDISFPSSLNVLHALKPVATATPPPPPPAGNLRPASPYSRRPSSPWSAGPVAISRSIIESLNKTNELLNQEVSKLQGQVKIMRQRCEIHNVELQKSEKKAKEAASLAAEGSSRCSVANELIISLRGQILFDLNSLTEKLSAEDYDAGELKDIYTQVEAFLKNSENYISQLASSMATDSSDPPDKSPFTDEGIDQQTDSGDATGPAYLSQNSIYGGFNSDVSKSVRIPAVRFFSDGEELTEQFEHGVYVTYIQCRNGTKVFRRVRFREYSLIKRRFANQQAEDWWKENKDQVFKKYICPVVEGGGNGSPKSAGTPAEEDSAASSQA